jgi:hypothetical protein
MGWRQIVDDARRLHFVILLVAATALSIWAGTYWGWWAYMWDIALPVRIVGVLAVSASAFVFWYALLFSSHYYFGIPRRNPLIGPRIESDVEQPNLHLALHGGWQDETYLISVTNYGNSDTFAVETTWMQGAAKYPTLPAMMRWLGVEAEKREIVKGHTHKLEVCRYERVAQGDQHAGLFRHLWLLVPGGGALDLLTGPCTYVDLYVSFKVTSVTTGQSDTFHMKLIFVSTGVVHTSASLAREDNSVYSL